MGSRGLSVDDLPDSLTFNCLRASPHRSGRMRQPRPRIDVSEVITSFKPSMLIGTSAKPCAPTEAIVREMAARIGPTK